MLRTIVKLLKVLNSENDPRQISLAFSFSMVAGLTPLVSVHNLLVLFLVLLLRVNISAFILGFLLFSGIAYVLDPLFHWLGLLILTADPLQGLWTAFYNSTVWRLEKFNNSIVMGSLVFSVFFFTPFFLILNKLILKYRENVMSRLRKSRIMQTLKATKFYNLYQSLSGWGGAL